MTGCLQVCDLLAACTEPDGADFDLRRFHDRLWQEGNVPLTLQRWELSASATTSTRPTASAECS